MMIPALSVKQPWAYMIRGGKKTIETRTWRTYYRGPLAICSSAAPKGQGETRRALCVVFLKHCRPMVPADERAACCPIYERAMAWEFAEEHRVVLMGRDRVRGQMGIWSLSLPEYEFICPDDIHRVEEWLRWSLDRGFMQKIQHSV